MEKLQPVQNLKPLIAEKIFKGERETLKSLYKKLLEPEMVEDLRSYYEEDSTTSFSDKEFANMMVLYSCFILYDFKGHEDIPEINSNQIVLAHQDLFLLENQIHFKPSDRLYLCSVWFSKGWLRFSANVKLPQITVDDSTKHMLLNMIAYETCLGSIGNAWVTSYVCFLDSLIDNPQDVKILRKSWVLDTSCSDEEVAKLFNEIGTNLVPNYDAYLRTRLEIQKHYESWSNTAFSQLKNEYFKSPWAIFVLLGALLGLLLTAVQTYSALTGECDNLCKSLKKNHHL
ncbi:putative UPF0481 protein At3g02645 [Bidens hawaiensis]|uniref:putative UPF0481 protein At3g02645 n=1 Tax=Bidens hawaiensis TaxID=980011 RepID=UPI00404B78C1